MNVVKGKKAKENKVEKVIEGSWDFKRFGVPNGLGVVEVERIAGLMVIKNEPKEERAEGHKENGEGSKTQAAENKKGKIKI